MSVWPLHFVTRLSHEVHLDISPITDSLDLTNKQVKKKQSQNKTMEEVDIVKDTWYEREWLKFILCQQAGWKSGHTWLDKCTTAIRTVKQIFAHDFLGARPHNIKRTC